MNDETSTWASIYDEYVIVEQRVALAVLMGQIEPFPGVGYRVLAHDPPNPGNSYRIASTLQEAHEHLRQRERMRLRFEQYKRNDVTSSSAAR